MAAGYLQTRFDARATFELFVRHLPPHRNYLVAAGLDQALDFLENVHFTAKEIDFLRRHPVFRNIRGEFFDYVATFRFTGDVWAMPEGSLVFPGEPMVRIVAPIIEGLMFAQWYQPAMPIRQELITQVHECQEQLFRSWAECRPASRHRANI